MNFATTQVAAIISSSDLRYVAQAGATASVARIVSEVTMLDKSNEILEAFGLKVQNDGAALTAAQVFMVSYIKEEQFDFHATMMEAQMKIYQLSNKSYYGIKNEQIQFVLDDIAMVEQEIEEKVFTGKRGRARNIQAWEIAEAVFISNMNVSMPEMVQAIDAAFSENSIDAVCTNMIRDFEEKYSVSLVRGKRGGNNGRTKNEAAWNIAEETFNSVLATNPNIMFNDMVAIVEEAMSADGHTMTGTPMILKLEEQMNVKLGRNKRGRKARIVEMA